MGLEEVCQLTNEKLTRSEPFGMLVWSTGLAANPFVERLEGVSHDEKTKSCVYISGL